MSEMYAVALSFSQGKRHLNASATLRWQKGDEYSQLSLEFQELERFRQSGDMAGFLLHALESVVNGFDDHQVTAAEQGKVNYAAGSDRG